MRYVISILGMVAAFFMIKYREQIGNMFGDADWMSKFGGIYNIVIIAAIFVFFWSIAYMTGTMGILFSPLLWFIPGLNRGAVPSDF